MSLLSSKVPTSFMNVTSVLQSPHVLALKLLFFNLCFQIYNLFRFGPLFQLSRIFVCLFPYSAIQCFSWISVPSAYSPLKAPRKAKMLVCVVYSPVLTVRPGFIWLKVGARWKILFTKKVNSGVNKCHSNSILPPLFSIPNIYSHILIPGMALCGLYPEEFHHLCIRFPGSRLQK